MPPLPAPVCGPFVLRSGEEAEEETAKASPHARRTLVLQHRPVVRVAKARYVERGAMRDQRHPRGRSSLRAGEWGRTPRLARHPRAVGSQWVCALIAGVLALGSFTASVLSMVWPAVTQGAARVVAFGCAGPPQVPFRVAHPSVPTWVTGALWLDDGTKIAVVGERELVIVRAEDLVPIGRFSYGNYAASLKVIAAFLRGDATVVVVLSDGRMFEVRWQQHKITQSLVSRISSGGRVTAACPVAAGIMLGTASGQLLYVGPNFKLQRVRPVSDSSITAVAAAGGYLFVGTGSGQVAALHGDNFKQQWALSFGSGRVVQLLPMTKCRTLLVVRELSRRRTAVGCWQLRHQRQPVRLWSTEFACRPGRFSVSPDGRRAALPSGLFELSKGMLATPWAALPRSIEQRSGERVLARATSWSPRGDTILLVGRYHVRLLRLTDLKHLVSQPLAMLWQMDMYAAPGSPYIVLSYPAGGTGPLQGTRWAEDRNVPVHYWVFDATLQRGPSTRLGSAGQRVVFVAGKEPALWTEAVTRSGAGGDKARGAARGGWTLHLTVEHLAPRRSADHVSVRLADWAYVVHLGENLDHLLVRTLLPGGSNSSRDHYRSVYDLYTLPDGIRKARFANTQWRWRRCLPRARLEVFSRWVVLRWGGRAEDERLDLLFCNMLTLREVTRRRTTGIWALDDSAGIPYLATFWRRENFRGYEIEDILDGRQWHLPGSPAFYAELHGSSQQLLVVETLAGMPTARVVRFDGRTRCQPPLTETKPRGWGYRTVHLVNDGRFIAAHARDQVNLFCARDGTYIGSFVALPDLEWVIVSARGFYTTTPNGARWILPRTSTESGAKTELALRSVPVSKLRELWGCSRCSP